MAIDQSKVHEYATRLLKSRMRILADNGFYGFLLEHLPFALDEDIETACTDADKIYFSPDFLNSITDSELDFVLMHEVLHVVLQHCFRYTNKSVDETQFNIACDTVVNSTILQAFDGDLSKISIGSLGGELYHIAPNGEEGYKYTAEEIYEMLMLQIKKEQGNGTSEKSSDDGINGNKGKPKKGKNKSQGRFKGMPSEDDTTLDSHDRWTKDESGERGAKWQEYLEDAIKSVKIDKSSKSRGTIPAFAERYLEELSTAKTDWRAVLCEFVQEEICDYSFSPPDRRFGDSDFFLPDFNEKEESVKNLLFMIDTSGSMSDELVTEAFNEVRGALIQFNERLEGLLGFFDAVVVEPKPFSSITELEIIRPKGGGGTSFDVIFDYVENKMSEPPYAIIIITDGYAPFPSEKRARGIPVLWIINNDDVTPPWGKVIRIPSL